MEEEQSSPPPNATGPSGNVPPVSLDEEALQEILLTVAGEQDPPCFGNWGCVRGFPTQDIEDAFCASLALPQLRGLVIMSCAGCLLFLISASRFVTGTSQHVGIYEELVAFLVTPIYGLGSISGFGTSLWWWNEATRQRNSIRAMILMQNLAMLVNGVVLLLAYNHRQAVSTDGFLDPMASAILYLFPLCAAILFKSPVYQCTGMAVCFLVSFAVNSSLDSVTIAFTTIGVLAVNGIILFAAQDSRQVFISRLNTIHFQARSQTQAVLLQQNEIDAYKSRVEQDKITLAQKSETAAYRRAVARMAHDLQTPIAAMRSGLNMISRKAPSAYDKQDTATHVNMSNSVQPSELTATNDMSQADTSFILSTIMAANRWCEMFVDDGIRELKMLNGGAQAFVCQPVFQSVRSMVEETVTVLASSKQFANAVKFELDIAPLVPPIVELDACGRRMLMNLMSNACRNTEVGLIHVDVRPEFAQPELELLRFTVTDTGCGIEDELKPQLFEPFISNGGGIGLGMYMVKEQSEALGGRCGHTDNPTGNGSVFFFSIPFTAIADKSSEHLVDSNGPNAKLEQVILVTESPERNSEHPILLVDDNIQLLHLCAMELDFEGWLVNTAHGAQEALELMKANIYSMILCDLNMPHKNGTELCIEFREWELENTTRSTPQAIFAMTGFTDEDVVEKCMAAGMQGVVQKPLDATKLTNCLAQCSNACDRNGPQTNITVAT